MKRLLVCCMCTVLTFCALSALANTKTTLKPTRTNSEAVDSGRAEYAAGTKNDSILIMGPWGSGAPYNGQFETELGEPAWNGWFGVDLTEADGPEGTVGDFAWVTPTGDADECASNSTPQALFVNYGQYADLGLEGTVGINYRYGPNGYVVDYNGGLAGEGYHLNNAIRSPIMAWPDQNYDGILLDFDVYVHETIYPETSTGMYYEYRMRSTDSDNPVDIESVPFYDNSIAGFGGPEFRRCSYNAGEAMTPGRKWVQIELVVHELGWLWGIEGDDGTPAPSFDNVRLNAFQQIGPAMSCLDADMANDRFPATGIIDYENLGNNSVRFDMARNVSPSAHQHLDFGDSIVITCAPVRTGSVLAASPSMFYKVFTNPLFDDFRFSGQSYEGEVVGAPQPNNKFSFDLPDSNFLFPGDVLHYYFRGVDDLSGDQTVALLPADTSHYGEVADMYVYNQDYVVRALPTMYSSIIDDQPNILLWNDSGPRGGQNEWHDSLESICFFPGWDNDGTREGCRYDSYYTTAPSSGVGNGLGGTASAEVLAGYDAIFYTSGNLSSNTISSVDWNDDAGDDIGILDNWLRLGYKSMFITGDEVAFCLATGDAQEQAFLADWMGLSLVMRDIRGLIGNQAAPLVKSIRTVNPLNDVFAAVPQWIAYGGCPEFNTFDAVQPIGTAVAIAEFSYWGDTGAYPYSAATLNYVEADDATIISMPYDLMYLHNDPDGTAKAISELPTRARVLDAVTQYFGFPWKCCGEIGAVDPDLPPAQQFTTSNYPNPFNPDTDIQFNMPKTGHLSVKVYNARGELVKTLVDEVHKAGPGSVTWDGTNNHGAKISSGVYFYEARTNGEVRVNKMALIK